MNTINNKKLLLENDIIAMLDHFVQKGGGHMNVDVNAACNSPIKRVKETNSSECNSKQTACQIPTLQEGLDQA